MYLINKLFNDKTIRTVWDKEQEKYFISVVDIVGALAESDNPLLLILEECLELLKVFQVRMQNQ